MMISKIEQHPLKPFLPSNARVLLLGSFPPPKKRWKMDFYYPNFQNDMWRILGLVFFNQKDQFIDLVTKTFKEEEIKQFLEKQGIAIYDTAKEIIRHQDNAADKFLEVVTATDLKLILDQIPHCNAIITTGDKATQTLMQSFSTQTLMPKINQPSNTQFQSRTLHLYRLPSSSRAYPLALEQKAKVYADCFKQIFIDS